MPLRPRRHIAAAGVVMSIALATVAGCSADDDDAGAATTTTQPAQLDCAAHAPVLKVDQIAAAVAAVEAQLGGPQRYFEINATDLLVNLFVAVDDGTKAQPFVFIQGELSSQDAKAAQGGSFLASALDFDPQKVTSCVTDQLPSSDATAFEIVANTAGDVQYSIVTTSPEGGQLIVTVQGDGRVLSVDPA